MYISAQKEVNFADPTCMYVCMHVCVYACMCAHTLLRKRKTLLATPACMCVCMCEHACMHTYARYIRQARQNTDKLAQNLHLAFIHTHIHTYMHVHVLSLFARF